MATEQELTTAITRIETVLNSGATKTVVDGVSVDVDHASLRKRLRELRRELAEVQSGRRRRPLMLRPDVSSM